MIENEAQELLRVMQATWPNQQIEETQAALWCSTLAPLAFDAASAAFAVLKATKHFMPSHAEFVTEAEAAAVRIAQQAERAELEPPKFCMACDGTGFVFIATVSGAEAVEPCRCRAKPSDEHKRGCTCGHCHYGPKRWAAILAGIDGAGPRRPEDVDPLLVKAQEAF